MSTCWACGAVEPREYQVNLVIRANPSALEDLSVRLCLECQIKVRRTLHDIQDQAATHTGGQGAASEGEG